jgi:NAD(P)-dependent dehydrogenase (short-subunit alcohol dehydrogenase family)
MKRTTPHATRFDTVKGKVVVVSGGANGIGAATVERLARNQARVVFGDMDVFGATAVLERLEAEEGRQGEVTFVQGKITDHADVYKLFKTAYDKYGRIDHVFELTATIQQVGAIDPELSIEAVEHTEKPTESLKANMDGNATFAKLAIVFLRSDKRRKDNRSLTLTGWSGNTSESPQGYLNRPWMHGTTELMRSIPQTIYERDGIRVNCIYPGRTESLTNTSNVDTVDSNEQPQTHDDCARFYVGVANNPSMNGKSIYVEGGKGWEHEDGLRQSMSK